MAKNLFKNLTLAAATLLAAATATASVKDCLVIHTTDNQKTYYVLEDVPVVTFVDEHLHIKSTNLEHQIKFDTVDKFTFEQQEVTALKELEASECRISLIGKTLTLEGFATGSPVAVYALNGSKAAQGVVDADGTAVIELSTLGAGVYVVSTVSKSFKIILK